MKTFQKQSKPKEKNKKVMNRIEGVTHTTTEWSEALHNNWSEVVLFLFLFFTFPIEYRRERVRERERGKLVKQVETEASAQSNHVNSCSNGHELVLLRLENRRVSSLIPMMIPHQKIIVNQSRSYCNQPIANPKLIVENYLNTVASCPFTE